MLLRQLQYLVALANERHFARAAAACSVTQPTLSAGIKQLEEEIGVLLVLRSQRFEGFTPEGERVLGWARRIVLEFDALRQEASRMRGELHGEVNIGAVPMAIPVLPRLVTAFARAHPRVSVSLLSIPSAEIQRRLEDHSLDAGVTYLDGDTSRHLRQVPLYEEHYVLVLGGEDGWAADRERIAWAEVPERPYCLLTRNMQNRRIIDEQLQRADVRIEAAAETDSVATLVGLLATGEWASIVPQSLLSLLRAAEHRPFRSLRLDSPSLGTPIGLVVSGHDPLTPAARELLALTERLAQSTTLV